MNGRIGTLVRRFSLAVSAVLVAVPSGAGAATQIGETFTPPGGVPCAKNTTFLQSISPAGRAQYAAPSPGVITRWSFAAGSNPPFKLKFKVGRSAGGTMFTMIGESSLVAPVTNTLNSFFTMIPTQAGDIIGLYTDTGNTGSEDCRRGFFGYSTHSRTGDVVPPTTANFSTFETQRQLDVSALLEPDCDNDGLGDETQDTNLSACGVTPLTCRGKQLTIVGTNGPDLIVGTPGADVIGALAGNDTVSGLARNDVICGGAGKDTLKGGKGKDTLLGQAGKDKLKGGGANDICKGGKGNDSAAKCEVEKSI
jgi:hypothetical protein